MFQTSDTNGLIGYRSMRRTYSVILLYATSFTYSIAVMKYLHSLLQYIFTVYYCVQKLICLLPFLLYKLNFNCVARSIYLYLIVSFLKYYTFARERRIFI